MITEDQIITYFERIAGANHVLKHNIDGGSSFFSVEDPDELSNFDDALRSMTGDIAFLTCAMEGELDDNGSENHVQSIDLQVFVVRRRNAGVSIASCRTECLEILTQLLGRIKRDARVPGNVIPGKKVEFKIAAIPVKKVGPMNMEWYGYTAFLRFSCPFGYTVDSGTWSDI